MQINSHRQELKEKILDASIQMFSRQGIRQVRMDDIARSLSISKRTLYEIYENKEQLLMDVVRKQEKKHLALRDEIASKHPNTIEWIVYGYRLQMKELSNVNPAFFVDLEEYKKVKEFIKSEHDKRKEEFKSFVEEGIREGYFKGDFDFEVIQSILEAVSQFIMNANMYKEYGMPTLFHNVIMVFLRGVCTLKGIALLDSLMQNVEDNNER